jgi:hypothetical protein
MNIALAAARANPESTPRLLLTVGKAVFRVPRVPGWHQLGIVFVTGPTFARLWERGGVSPIGFDEGGPVSDCRRFDERSLSELGISALIRKPDARFLQLRARAHSACISYPVEAFDPDAPYSFSIEYRTVRGPTPRICVWQVGPNRCVETRPLQRSSQWKRFAITLTPEPGTVGLQFFVYADGESTTSTVTEFQSLAVGRSRLISRRRINPAAIVQIGNASEANPIPRERLAQLPIAISDASSVIDCRRIDDRSISDVGISAVVTRRLGGPILRLRARAHSACASVAVPTATTGTYALSFDYRRRTGSRPRLCVWQVGPDECLDLPPLADEDKWRSFQARIKLDPATSGVFLFFYADGPDAAGKRTTTEYRNLALARVIETGLIAEQSRGAPLPRLRYRKESPHEFRVKVSGAREPFLLTLTETYASGWSLKRRGIRSGQGKHVRVNGYANGWIVPWRGDYELVLTYSPERVAATAWFVSALALAILVISIVRRELPRLRRADELTAP